MSLDNIALQTLAVEYGTVFVNKLIVEANAREIAKERDSLQEQVDELTKQKEIISAELGILKAKTIPISIDSVVNEG